VHTVNQTMVYTYYEIGRMIVEDEQQGKERAAYGRQVLKELSKELTANFGKGFSVDNLQNMRQFYLSYSIYETTSRKFVLSWSHYLSNSCGLKTPMNAISMKSNAPPTIGV